MSENVLAHIDLTDCPEGTVFDPTDPNWEVNV